MAVTNRRERAAAQREADEQDAHSPLTDRERSSAGPSGIPRGSGGRNRPPQSQQRSGPSQRPSQRSSGGPLKGRKGTAADALRIFAGLGA